MACLLDLPIPGADKHMERRDIERDEAPKVPARPSSRVVIAGAVSVLLALGIGVILFRGGNDDGVVRAATSGAAPALPDEAVAAPSTTSTMPTTTSTTALTSTTIASSTTTTTRPASTTTTTRPPTPKRTFTISPSSGAVSSEVVASGTGCAGDGYGASLEIRDSAGQGITGTGGASMADGTWQVPFRFPSVPPGRYTVHASCISGATVLFDYSDATFTLTG